MQDASVYPPANAKHIHNEGFLGSSLVVWTPIQGGRGGWVGAVIDPDGLVAYESQPQETYGKAQGVAKRWCRRNART